MLMVWILKPLLTLGAWVVSLFPVADTTEVVAAVAPASRLVGWVMQLNAAFPVVELLAAVGFLLSVYVAMYAVMLVRRVFSLFWPGAGS